MVKIENSYAKLFFGQNIPLKMCMHFLCVYIIRHSTRNEIWWLDVLQSVGSNIILESKPELLEKVVKTSHHDGKVYYVNHYSLSVVKMETLREIFTIYDGYVSLSSILIFQLQ